MTSCAWACPASNPSTSVSARPSRCTGFIPNSLVTFRIPGPRSGRCLSSVVPMRLALAAHGYRIAPGIRGDRQLYALARAALVVIGDQRGLGVLLGPGRDVAMDLIDRLNLG